MLLVLVMVNQFLNNFNMLQVIVMWPLRSVTFFYLEPDTWNAGVVYSPQLRFERHPSVHKVFLNIWGEQNHRRQWLKLVLTRHPATLTCNKFTPPTLVSFCTHASLSNLSWEPRVECGQVSLEFHFHQKQTRKYLLHANFIHNSSQC